MGIYCRLVIGLISLLILLITLFIGYTIHHTTVTMTSYFQNQFKDYASTECDILNESRNGISEKFHDKLNNFKLKKLQILTTKMRKNIFYDGTVYTGSAGIALYYFVCGVGEFRNKNQLNHDLLMTALSYIDLNNLKSRRITFLCGDAGPLALATVISYMLDNKRPDSLPDYKSLTHRLLSLINLLKDSPDELLYGRAGYLYSLLFVNKYIDAETVIPNEHIKKVIGAILESGKQFAAEVKSESPLLWQWHNKIYLGGAHGVAGILYILLQAREYIDDSEIHASIKPTLDWLVSQRFKSGNLPSSLRSSSDVVQWCHGAPGIVPLCILANQIFEQDKYMKIALQCGDVVWQKGLCSKGYSICHGVSGNAYTFIQLYHATKDPSQLYRASCFVEWCADEAPGTERHAPDRPASLFEGLTGRLYLMHDLANLDAAKFPAYTV